MEDKYFVFAANQYGYDRILHEDLSLAEAERKAKKESAIAWRLWKTISHAHNNVFEVYPEDSDPDVDEPVFSIK